MLASRRLIVCSWLCLGACAADEQEDPARVDHAIVGGQTAQPGEIGWQAGLFMLDDGAWVHLCGGTLVDARAGWVVTAAHCVADMPADTLRVTVGERTRSTIAPEAYRVVEDVFVHPAYDEESARNDLALLKVQGIDPNAVAARIAGTGPLDGFIGPGWSAISSGWGATEAEAPESEEEEAYEADLDEWGRPDTLRWVRVPIAPQAECARRVHDPEDPALAVTDSMICAGSQAGGRDACYGDSGGPLVVTGLGQPILIGVTSWGLGCEWPGYYGVYTRVRAYRDWLLGCMRDPNRCG